MKIIKVVATDPQTKDKQVFTFGTATEGKSAVTTRGGKLHNYFQFCFTNNSECARDVEIHFAIDQDEYLLVRAHNEDGTTRSTLKKVVDGRQQVVSRTHATEYLEQIIGAPLSNVLKLGYVNNRAIDAFHGDLRIFDEIRLLADVQSSIAKSTADAKALKDDALKRVKKYSENAPSATPEILDALNNELTDIAHKITVATAELGELKSKQNAGAIREDINRQLKDTQNKYDKLVAREHEIEQARAKVKLHDDVELLMPKIKTLRALSEQRDEHEKARYSINNELDWQEGELVSLNQQLEEKERQYALSQDKRSRVEAINNALTYIASLYEKNKQLNETLLDLNDKQERLSAEKALYNNKLELVERSIAEVREDLDAFQIPARSVGELLEAVRVDVKIDEVNAQIEKTQSEIAVKESQIAEKESNLVVQIKRFRAVAELDVAVTPIKAKDTILQVLDTKYSKLESVNISLREKQRNLERALEDYKYRLLQLEQSKSRLEAEREKTLLRKQEEFKREVYLNSQKVYSEDASGVFAVNISFHDQEMQALNDEISARNMDRDLLLERTYQLDGSLKEIKRHIEINNAEMETLQGEKDNINKRYNEIVSQNSSEVVFNYLKALQSDNGTKYLLDIQHDAVRSESELVELKHSIESLRSKLAALKSRLKYLHKTQAQMDDTRASVDMLVSSNDKLKEELTDIGERLSTNYEQYKAITRQIESIESKLDDIRGAIIETSKTIKVNEDQIAESNAKAQSYAGGADLEQAIANLRYEVGDVESERQMLIESKQTTEKEIFKKRLELEKMQWLYDTKCREYDELHHELSFELKLKGLDIDQVSKMDLDASVESLRNLIKQFDVKRSALSEKIDNLNSILKSQPASNVSAEDIASKQKLIDALTKRQRELEASRNEQLNGYVAASTARAKVSVAAAEARTLNNLRDTLSHNEIVTVLIRDKLKSMLHTAGQHLKTLLGADYRLVEEDFKLSVVSGMETIDYDDLTDEAKTAVYLSTLLSVPNTDASDHKWLIFDERISIDKKVLADMLRKVANVSYVVQCSGK